MAKPGKKVVVQYVGQLASNGRIFDETKGNSTFTFRLGVGEVIKGELAEHRTHHHDCCKAAAKCLHPDCAGCCVGLEQGRTPGSL